MASRAECKSHSKSWLGFDEIDRFQKQRQAKHQRQSFNWIGSQDGWKDLYRRASVLPLLISWWGIAGHPTHLITDLEPEVGPWSLLEYTICASECASTGSRFLLTSLPSSLSANLPGPLQEAADKGTLTATSTAVPELEGIDPKRVCLLDPAAKEDLNPGDRERFDWFVFGGILGELGWGLRCGERANGCR